jgi:hypothetical protein
MTPKRLKTREKKKKKGKIRIGESPSPFRLFCYST